MVYELNVANTVKKALIVLDPGLEGESGHHYALFESAKNKKKSLDNISEIKFFAHTSADHIASLQDSMESGVSIFGHFKTKLYEYYSQRPSVAEANHYIVRLAAEYRLAISDEVGKVGCNQAVIFLYPAVKWEHLAAIAIATTELRRKKNIYNSIEHKVCLMFNPGLTEGGDLCSAKEYLGYKMTAFLLRECPEIHVYASDYELSKQYQKLLSRQVPIHPCYLFDFPSLVSERAPAKKTHRHIGLYHGDAKREKGFLNIPQALEFLMPQLDCDDRVYIQFTVKSSDKRLVEIARVVQALARQDARIIVEEGFVAGENLMAQISCLSEYIFLYDSEHYQNKSSGIAWIIAFFQCPATTIGDSWISRELKRLGVPIKISTSLRGIGVSEGWHSYHGEDAENELRSCLYDDFWQRVVGE